MHKQYHTASLILLLAASPLLAASALACAEGGAGVPVEFSGTVKAGEMLQKDITQHFYYDTSLSWWKTKVAWPDNGRPHTYFWLVPDDSGWQIKVGPLKDLAPDYIAIASLPVAPVLHIDKATPPKTFRFCFNDSAEDYQTALAEIKKDGHSDMIDIFSASCKAKDESLMGMGTLTVRGLSSDRLEFKARLTVPVYTTDCPPP